MPRRTPGGTCPGWVRAAGFDDIRGVELAPGPSPIPRRARWWGELWADRVEKSRSFAEQAVAYGLSDRCGARVDRRRLAAVVGRPRGDVIVIIGVEVLARA